MILRAWLLGLVIAADLSSVALAKADWPTTRGMHPLEADIPGAGRVLYAVSVPSGYKPGSPAPLVLVLHPGGQGPRYYGGQFMRSVVEPALRSMQAIMIAPDCPARNWSDAVCDTASTALIEQAMKAYTIDRKRVLVVGFSMGGRGTWHMASKHAELFTAAIPMAASIRGLAVEDLGKQPTYVIHSRDDEVVPFEPAEETAAALKKLKRDVHFEALEGLTHFEMVNYVDALRDAARWVAGRWKD